MEGNRNKVVIEGISEKGKEEKKIKKRRISFKPLMLTKAAFFLLKIQ